jgi:dipeptide transport system substrate-binding protein
MTKAGLMAAMLAATLFNGVASAEALVYCVEQSPEGFDPGLYTTETSFDASSKPVYDRLVEFKRGAAEVTPGLAKKWDVSEDGLNYTFHLREGVKFQTTDFFTPSRDLDADDVIFSFERMLDKNNSWHDYAGGHWPYFETMSMPTLIKSIEKVDDVTVKFTLTRRDAAFLADMAMGFASIMSKEYADNLDKDGHKERLNRQPLGTGPFQFVSYQQEAVIRYKAHPNYWDGRQPVDDLVFAITSDAAEREKKRQAGECQLMPDRAPADSPALKKIDKLTEASR